MNTHAHPRDLKPSSWTPTTQAAEGMARRRFSVAEIEQMVAAGIIPEHERFELIGGEVVPMSPKGATHEKVKGRLNWFFQRAVPAELDIYQETTLHLSPDTYVEPDFCVFPHDFDLKKLDGSIVKLAVEVADSSFAYDTGRKLSVYAAYGVREVWVVNANTLLTRIHRQLGGEGYGFVRDLGPDELLTPVLVPELVVRLADLGLRAIKSES